MHRHIRVAAHRHYSPKSSTWYAQRIAQAWQQFSSLAGAEDLERPKTNTDIKTKNKKTENIVKVQNFLLASDKFPSEKTKINKYAKHAAGE